MTGLDHLNSASQEEAFASLLACCGSTKWAERLVEARPFSDRKALEEAADRTTQDLGQDDWIEAFASHPKIGAHNPGQPEESEASAGTSHWPAEEQAGTRAASRLTLSALATANFAYEDRFGHIFIVCASGKSGEEMLALCRERLDNDPATELRVACNELRKIAQIRLRKLIGGDE